MVVVGSGGGGGGSIGQLASLSAQLLSGGAGIMEPPFNSGNAAANLNSNSSMPLFNVPPNLLATNGGGGANNQLQPDTYAWAAGNGGGGRHPF